MAIQEVLSELKELYGNAPTQEEPFGTALQQADVQRWASECDLSRPELYDEIAAHLAVGFESSALNFGFCDAVVNNVFAVSTAFDDLRQPLFWAVYLAFDEGEYFHGNNRDEDPEEVYTRPMIAQAIQDYGLMQRVRPF